MELENIKRKVFLINKWKIIREKVSDLNLIDYCWNIEERSLRKNGLIQGKTKDKQDLDISNQSINNNKKYIFNLWN